MIKMSSAFDVFCSPYYVRDAKVLPKTITTGVCVTRFCLTEHIFSKNMRYIFCREVNVLKMRLLKADEETF